MKEKVEGNGLQYIYKTHEALTIALAQLGVVEKIKVGYGISTKNHKVVIRVLKKLSSAEKQLHKVVRKWMK